jgi:hypothetical protein
MTQGMYQFFFDDNTDREFVSLTLAADFLVVESDLIPNRITVTYAVPGKKDEIVRSCRSIGRKCDPLDELLKADTIARMKLSAKNRRRHCN